MIVVFPEYKFYSAKNNMQKSVIDNYVKTLDYKIISKCRNVNTFLEDKLADELLNKYQNCVTAVAQSEYDFLMFSKDLEVDFPNRFYDNYIYTNNISGDVVKRIKTISPAEVKDKAIYNAKRKQVFIDRMKDASRTYISQCKVALIFTANNQSNRFKRIEPAIGDGLLLIYADLNTCITTCYFGGIYFNEDEIIPILEGLQC